MLKFIAMLFSIYFMSGCVESTSSLKDNANNSYKHSEDDSSGAELKSPKTGKNLLTEDHIICFECETGFYPKSVQQLVKFSPTNKACKTIFTNKRFYSNQPGFNHFLITAKEFDKSVVFAMSKKGFELENIWTADAFFNLTIDKNVFSCTNQTGYNN
jgi:hypothetical protein